MIRRLYLMEKLDSEFDCRGKGIVSLHPSVSYVFGKRGISYSIPESFYEEKAFAAHAKNYFDEQLKWLEAFDEFCKENISYCRQYDIPLATANYLRLKYLVDTAYIYTYSFSGILDKNRSVDEVIYMRGAHDDEDVPPSPFLLKSKSRRLFSDIIHAVCEARSVKFTDLVMNKKEEKTDSTPKIKYPSLFENKLIRDNFKGALNFFRYGRFNKIFAGEKHFSGINIFVMHTGSKWIDEPIKELIKYGANVFVAGKGHTETGYLSRRLRDELIQAADNLGNSCLPGWLDDKCGYNLSSVILPFLEYFIKEDCLRILADMEKAFHFYRKNKIEYLIVRANTDINSVGWILAARCCKGAKSICIQHACLNQELDAYGIMDTQPYDYFITADSISEGFYSGFAKGRFKSNCGIFASSHYLKDIQKRFYGGKRRRNEREKIIYIVSKFSEGVRALNNMGYPITWYYEFQKRLMDIFGKEHSFDFIYKTVKRTFQKNIDLPVISYIKDKGYSNIHVCDDDFLKVLEDADRVIVDQPSTTALFESACAGKPVLVIYPDYLDESIFKRSKEVFGYCLQPFSNFEGIEKTVKEFLGPYSDKYRVNIPLSKDSFIGAFQKIIEGRKTAEKEREIACAA